MEKGFWFCNYIGFEQRSKVNNRTILNFYYVPTKAEKKQGKKPKKVKLFAKTNVRIPTDFIYGKENLEKIINKVESNEELNIFHLDYEKKGNFYVASIDMPYNRELIKLLPKKFQTGDYEKMLKLSGFFPDRIISMNDIFEDIVDNAKIDDKGEKEIELGRLFGLFNKEFMTESQFRSLHWFNWDIEKCLYKKEDEKKWIKKRKNYIKLKKEKDYPKEFREKRLDRAIKILEDRLTFYVEDVGEIKWWEEKYDAKISSIASIAENCGEDEKDKKDIIILDPLKEVKHRKVEGSNIHASPNEKGVLRTLNKLVDEEYIPAGNSAHNLPYDDTQTAMAGKKLKEEFTPGVKGKSPSRDLVRKFYQRMKQTWISIDTMRQMAIHFPWLQQRSLGVSLKLKDICKYHGYDFEKMFTHDELRILELKRLFGKTFEIRHEAGVGSDLYVTGDVPPVKWMKNMPQVISLGVKVKKIEPYCTYNEIFFGPNCSNKYMDYKHFQRCGNKRFSKTQRKIRDNEIQIFKKRLKSLKKKMLNHIGIDTDGKTGLHENVMELYLPLEEWLKHTMSGWAKEWLDGFNDIKDNEKIGYLQYVKTLQRDNMLLDYYFARREQRVFKEFNLSRSDIDKFKRIEQRVDQKKLDSFIGSFKMLKELFRSVYVPLKGDDRKSIRPGKKNPGQMYLFEEDQKEVPKEMGYEEDLYLLKENADKIRPRLTKAKKVDLIRFLNNFKTFERLWEDIARQMPVKSKRLVILYNHYKRKQKRENRFELEYGMKVDTLKLHIGVAYNALKKEMEKYDVKVIDNKGDYLFVKADERIKESKLWYVVREFDEFRVGDCIDGNSLF